MKYSKYDDATGRIELTQCPTCNDKDEDTKDSVYILDIDMSIMQQISKLNRSLIESGLIFDHDNAKLVSSMNTQAYMDHI